MAILSQSPRKLIRWFLQVALGGVFVYAGMVKIWGLGLMSFTDDIRSFHILEDPWVVWVAMSLPWLEIFAGLAVIFGPGRRGGLLLLLVSLIVFLVALVSAWVRGIDISCGCFGHTDQATAPWELILRDLALLAMAGYLIATAPKQPQTVQAD